MQINLNLNAAVVRQMFQMKLIFQISIQIQKHADLSRHLSMPFLDVALLLARTPRVSISVSTKIIACLTFPFRRTSPSKTAFLEISSALRPF